MDWSLVYNVDIIFVDEVRRTCVVLCNKIGIPYFLVYNMDSCITRRQFLELKFEEEKTFLGQF